MIASHTLLLGELEEIDQESLRRLPLDPTSPCRLLKRNTTSSHSWRFITVRVLRVLRHSIDGAALTRAFTTEQRFEPSDILSASLKNRIPHTSALFADPHNPLDVVHNLRLAEPDPLLTLMIESRFGFLSPGEPASDMRVTDVVVPSDRAPDLIRAAIAGPEGISGDWTMTIDGDSVFDRTPTALARQNLAKISNGYPSRAICVIGDTASDHSLYLLCDRVFSEACWIPRRLIEDNGPLGRAARLAVNTFLWSRRSRSHKPCGVVSATESHEFLSQFTTIRGGRRF